jgi:hypothetical protein
MTLTINLSEKLDAALKAASRFPPEFAKSVPTCPLRRAPNIPKAAHSKLTITFTACRKLNGSSC